MDEYGGKIDIEIVFKNFDVEYSNLNQRSFLVINRFRNFLFVFGIIGSFQKKTK